MPTRLRTTMMIPPLALPQAKPVFSLLPLGSALVSLGLRFPVVAETRSRNQKAEIPSDLHEEGNIPAHLNSREPSVQ